MKIKNRYSALGLLFSFISRDLIMSDKMKEKSYNLFDKVSSIIDNNKRFVKKTINKDRKISRKGSSKRSTNISNLIQGIIINTNLQKEGIRHNNNMQKDTKKIENDLKRKEVILKEENSQTKLLSGQFEESKRMVFYGILTPLGSANGELGENFESNEISFTMDPDLRPKSALQTISGSSAISYIEKIEEEDYDQHSLEEAYDEEEIRLGNRYNSYLEGVKYNVSSAIETIDKIYSNYKLFEE